MKKIKAIMEKIKAIINNIESYHQASDKIKKMSL